MATPHQALPGLVDAVLVVGYALPQAAAEIERYRKHMASTQRSAQRAGGI